MKSNLFKILLISICMLILIPSFAENLSGAKSYKIKGKEILFKTQDEKAYIINVVTDNILRFRFSNDGEFVPSKMIEYGYVKDDFQKTKFKVEDGGDAYQITTNALTVKIDKERFGFTIFDKEGNTITRSNREKGFSMENGNVINMDMPLDEHFFGFGFMRQTLDARGHKLTFKRAYRWKEATLPFFLSTRGYAFYSNSAFNQDFDFTAKSDGKSFDYYSVTAQNGDIDFYIIYGPDFPKMLDRYTDLTGKSMMVPKWAFGLEYRLRYYGEQQELLDIAKEFRNKEIPADIMALEPGWEEVSYSMKWKWSPERFPEPEKMIQELDDMGFKMDLWESGVAPTENITSPKTRKAWYNQRKDIIDMGVRMFKQDDPYPRSIVSSELLDPVFARQKFKDGQLTAEELNNVANTLYTETLFDEFRKQTNERAVVMFHAYNASVASHRWPFQWAGDFQAENGMLNASLSGHAMVSYDIRNPYAAGWHQGFFTPFTVVDAWAYYREPWLYSESIEQSHRVYACLRSRLVPYLYTSLWQSTKTGIPIERPMVLEYHNDPITHHMKSQFMVGDWFLLALSDVDDSPAGEKIDFWTGVQKGNNGRAYLPKGKWFNYWSGKEENIAKAKWVYDEWPEFMGGPLYVKAGAIIPMGQVKNYVDETSDKVLVLDVYPAGQSEYQLYEDDGVTYQYEKGSRAITDFICSETQNKVTLTISERKGQYEGMPENRAWLVKMHRSFKPQKVMVDGAELSYFTDREALIHSTAQKGWYYDEEAKKVIIKLDKGWAYGANNANGNPLATIPLTAKNERIVWASGSKLEDKSRTIEVQMPEKSVPVISTNIVSIPADGYSKALVNVHFINSLFGPGTYKVFVTGAAKLATGASEMDLTAEHAAFWIMAGTKPGEATIKIEGERIENQSMEFPIYGTPATIVLEQEAGILAADGMDETKITLRMEDAAGRLIQESGKPVVLTVDGAALCENGLQKDTVMIEDGFAACNLVSTTKAGRVTVKAQSSSISSNSISISSFEPHMQVRINPPEKVKLDSDGGWIPDHVDVFVNFKADNQWVRSIGHEVTLNVYSKGGELLDTYVQNAKKGEVIFKDISYYRRPAQCLFEIKCEGYETVSKKVFANTWDQDPNSYKKKKKKH